jgi:hypothetical protein
MGTYGYTYNNSALNGTPMVPLFPIFDGRRIVGLLSTPEYTDTNGFPLSTLMFGGISNHVVAYVRSISGPAVEKPPQDNDIMREDSFGYRVLCVNLPTAVDTNLFNPVFYPNGPSAYTTKFAANLHDLRLTFLWPQRPNGNVGPGRQTFRTLVGGQIEIVTNGLGRNLYFYQPQLFINAP